MISKSLIIMMLLVATTAASLVGITTIIYKPVNVETLAQRPLQQQSQQQQPTANQSQQQEQLTPNAGQVLRRYIVPPAQSPLSSSSIQSTAQRQQIINQAFADNQLLDRIFPQIIKRIDGATLLQKIDSRTLAAKVLPYLDLKISTTERDGSTATVRGTGPAPPSKIIGGQAGCAPGETVVSGGFILYAGSSGNIWASKKIINPDAWDVEASTSNGKLLTYATCLKAELTVEPATPPPPPPGIECFPGTHWNGKRCM